MMIAEDSYASKVDIPYSIIFLNKMPIFEQYVAPRTDTKKCIPTKLPQYSHYTKE